MNNTRPTQAQIEALLEDEDRRLLADPSVPEEVKNEIIERLERLKEGDVEHEVGDEPHSIATE